jgi:hypothetical protein
MKYLKKFDKKIKGFKQFISLIKESKSFWSEDISHEDFYDYLRDLVDERFDIEVENGFVDCLNPPKEQEGDPNQLKLFPADELDVNDDLIGDAESYKDDYEYFIFPGLICPSYKIHIEESDSSEGNFTEALLFFRRIVLSELGFQTAILVDDEVVDFQYIKVEDGQFHVRMYDDEELGYNTYDSIDLIVMSTEPIDFRIKDVAEYYGWNHYEIGKDGNLYFKFDLDDMADIVCYDKYQANTISNGLDVDDDNGYYPDVDDLVRYYLNEEAEKMLAKCIIMELGGVENIDGLEDMKEEEAIQFLTNENYRKKLVSLAEDSGVCDDLRSLYSGYHSSAQATAIYDALFSEFEEVVDKHFTYKYNSVECEYTIQFDSEWMVDLVKDDVDSDFFKNYDPDGIMKEWFERNDHSEKLSPRYSDGYVNINKFSADAIREMEHYLNLLRKHKENKENSTN